MSLPGLLPEVGRRLEEFLNRPRTTVAVADAEQEIQRFFATGVFRDVNVLERWFREQIIA